MSVLGALCFWQTSSQPGNFWYRCSSHNVQATVFITPLKKNEYSIFIDIFNFWYFVTIDILPIRSTTAKSWHGVEYFMSAICLHFSKRLVIEDTHYFWVSHTPTQHSAPRHLVCGYHRTPYLFHTIKIDWNYGDKNMSQKYVTWYIKKFLISSTSQSK